MKEWNEEIDREFPNIINISWLQIKEEYMAIVTKNKQPMKLQDYRIKNMFIVYEKR